MDVPVRIGAAMLMLAAAAPLVAACYIIPPDADLIRAADAIAIVEIRSSHSYYTADGRIATDHTALVESALKSPLREGMKIVITRLGGVVGDVGFGLSSEPRFLASERTLLALRRLDGGRYTTLSGELGKFSLVTDAQSRNLIARGAGEGEIFGWDLSGRVHVERPRDAASFVRYISAVVAGDNPAVDYFVSESILPRDVRTNSHVGPYEYSLAGNPRWEANGFTMKNVNIEAAEPDTIGTLIAAMGGWNGASHATINITHDGSDPAGRMRRDRRNVILFDTPIAGNSIGVAGHWFEGSHTFNGVSYASMIDCDIAIEEGITGSRLQSIVGHELGHCLGFRHSNSPASGQTTETSRALMNSSINSDPSLRHWDRDAASHLYGPGVSSCEAVGIVTHPQDVIITQGSSATLSVSASGSDHAWQWFIGTSGDTSRPIAEATGSSVSVSPSTTTSYWARVSQSCDGSTADSNTATVTVTPSGPGRRRAVGRR